MAFAMVVTSVATLSVGFVANLLLSTSRMRPFDMPFDNVKFVETFAAWDSGWYFDIARRGYYFEANSPSSIAFFPLYPMLIRLVAGPFGSTEQALWTSGILVSCASFALALLALHRLTQRILGDRETARRAVLYLAVFPFSFFFTRVYAESILLLTSVLAVSRAYDGNWTRAGLWGALATLSRPNGILIGLPLILLALRDWPTTGHTIRRLIPLLSIPAAFAGYCAFVYTLAVMPFGNSVM